MEPIKLNTVAEEMKKCYWRLSGFGEGQLVNFLHHQQPLEFLSEEDSAHRILYIATEKPEHERALRFRLFTHLKQDATLNLDPDWRAAYAKFVESQRAVVKARIEYDFWKEREDKVQEKRDSVDQVHATRIERDTAFQTLESVYMGHFERLFGVPWKGSIFETFPVFTESVEEETSGEAKKNS